MTPGAHDAPESAEITVDLSGETIAALHARAGRHGRTFDDEVVAVIEQATRVWPETPLGS